MNICWIKINYIFVRRIKWPEVHFMHNRKDCQLLSRRSSLLDWPHVGFVLFCLGVLGFGFSFFLIVCMLTVYFLEGEGCNYFHWSALKQNNANTCIILTTILIFKIVCISGYQSWFDPQIARIQLVSGGWVVHK